jgi:uncharacterized short protein YbdD (DUF466 family)
VDFKSHYFLQAGNDTVEELLFKLYMSDNDNIVSEWNRYKEQLREYEGDKLSSSLDREIDEARYAGSKLGKIVVELNGRESLVYEKTKEKSGNGPRFFVSAGADLSKLSASGNSDVFPEVGMNYKSNLGPFFSVGMDLSSARNFNDFTLRFEIAFSQNEYKGDKHSSNDIAGFPEYETYTMRQQTINPSVSAMYNFRRTKKVRYYIGLGLAYNISGYSMNRYTQVISIDSLEDNAKDDPIELEKNWPQIFLRAGARFGRKFEIGATGNIYSVFTNYDYFSMSSKTYSLKLTYFFN